MKTLSLCIEAKVLLVVICTVYFVSFVTCDLCLDIRSIHDISERVLRLLTRCLPFTRTNRSVHGLGKWQEKFSRVYHLYKSVSFTRKRPRTPETVIKDVFQEMEHEFPFGIFRPKKQDYLFRCSVVPGNVRLERPKKSCSITFQLDFPETC